MGRYRENHWQYWRNVVDVVENRWTGTSARLVANYASNYDWRMNREDVTLTGELASSQGGASGVKTEYATYLTNDVWDRDELRQTKVYSLSPQTEITARYRKWDHSVGHNRSKEYQTGSWLQTYANNSVDEITGITGTGGAPNVSLAYDWAGNMTTMPDVDGNAWTVTYDAENRPVKMQRSDDNLKLDLKYDYLGRRIEKKVSEWSGGQWSVVSSVRFVYDGWNLIAELDAEASNAVLRTFTWGLDASHTIGGAGGVGGLVRMEEDGKEYYPVYDPSHNVTGLMRKNVNGTLDLVASYVLGPFGEVISATAYNGFTDTNPFRFSTKYTDSETGLVYFGHRYYSPKLGRFVCRDPKEESGGINLFAFVQNNAINRWDYLGLDSPEDAINPYDHASDGTLNGFFSDDDFVGSMTGSDLGKEALAPRISYDQAISLYGNGIRGGELLYIDTRTGSLVAANYGGGAGVNYYTTAGVGVLAAAGKLDDALRMSPEVNRALEQGGAAAGTLRAQLWELELFGSVTITSSGDELRQSTADYAISRLSWALPKTSPGYSIDTRTALNAISRHRVVKWATERAWKQAVEANAERGFWVYANSKWGYAVRFMPTEGATRNRMNPGPPPVIEGFTLLLFAHVHLDPSPRLGPRREYPSDEDNEYATKHQIPGMIINDTGAPFFFGRYPLPKPKEDSDSNP